MAISESNRARHPELVVGLAAGAGHHRGLRRRVARARGTLRRRGHPALRPGRPARTRRPRRSRGCRQPLGPPGGGRRRSAGTELTTATRAPWRAALVRDSCWAKINPNVMIPKSRSSRIGETSANSTAAAPSSGPRAGRPRPARAPGPLSRRDPALRVTASSLPPAQPSSWAQTSTCLIERGAVRGCYRRTASPRSTVRTRRRPASFRRIAPNDRLGL